MSQHFSFRQPLLLAAALSVLLFCLAPSATAEPIMTIEQKYFAGEATSVDIELVIGSLEIEGKRGRNVEVVVELSCTRDDKEKCKRRAERIRLRPRLSGEKLYLALENTPRGRAGGIEAKMKIRMPKKMGLEIDIGGGDMKIEDIYGDIEIDSAGGSVDFTGDQDKVARFKADVGFGSGELILKDGRIEATGLPRSIKWSGQGQQRIEIDLGGGEIVARLE